MSMIINGIGIGLILLTYWFFFMVPDTHSEKRVKSMEHHH